jgi:hypothetical protein
MKRKQNQTRNGPFKEGRNQNPPLELANTALVPNSGKIERIQEMRVSQLSIAIIVEKLSQH